MTELNRGFEQELKTFLELAGISDPEMMSEIVAALAESAGVETEADLLMLKEGDLVEIGLKPVKARRVLKVIADKFAKNEAADQEVADASEMEVMPQPQVSYLRDVPENDASWLEVLRTANALKVSENTYIATVHAALAAKLNVFEAPAKLVTEMEKFAIENDEILSDRFYQVSNSLIQSKYGEIFAAMPGVDGKFVTKARRKETMKRLEQYFWPVLAKSKDVLALWWQTWEKMNNTSVILRVFMQYKANGGTSNPRVPDTGMIHEAATELRLSINRALAGAGPVVVTAMSYDYSRIKMALADPNLPREVGLLNHDQLYAKLGLQIGPGAISNERNLVKYVLNMVMADEVPAEHEMDYFQELYFLAERVNWDTLLPQTKLAPMCVTNAIGEQVELVPDEVE